ncbi:MAG TPA: DUF4397 domain-containing protein [Rhodanobacteraceae bacterium]
MTRSAALAFLVGSTASTLAWGDARVNVAHLAPFSASAPGTAVSVNVNGSQVLTGVQFNQISGYLTLAGPGVAPGSTLVEVFAPPATPPPAITGTFDLAADTDYTVAAIGDVSNQPLALLPLVDDNSPPSAGNVRLRIVHAAPFAASLPATAVSIRTQAGDIVNGLANVEFGQNSGYFELPAGTYDLKIATPDGATTLIDPAPVTLAAGTIATLFAVGDGSNQALGVTAVFGDGSSAILPLAPPPSSAPLPAPALSAWGIAALLTLICFIAVTHRIRARRALARK